MKANKDTEISGKVTKKMFAAGSKSEHMAVCIETAEGSFVLKRMGGNPFNDPVLNAMVGKVITAVGFVDDYQFIAKELKEK